MGYIKIPNKWMNEVDTGFGNRIPYWNLAYYLSRKHDFEFTILVDFYQWKDTKHIKCSYGAWDHLMCLVNSGI